MAFTSLGAAAGSVVAPVQSYTPATRTVSETLPAGFSAILILVDLRNVTSLTASISWTIEHSIDGGVNWINDGGAAINLAQSGYTLNGSNQIVNQEGGFVRMSGSTKLVKDTHLSRQVRIAFTNNETVTVGVTLMAW